MVTDDMPTVSKINIATSWVSNCEAFDKFLIDMVTDETVWWICASAVRQIWPLKLLKNHIKLHRTKGFSAVHCKVSDTTRI